MNTFRTLIYTLREGIINIKRGGIACALSIVTIAFTMLNIGLFMLVRINIAPTLSEWVKEVKVVAYLKDTIKEEGIDRLVKELRSLPQVKMVTFISKSHAFERFKQGLGEDRSLLEGLGENPLPASLELMIDESGGVKALDDVIAHLQNRDEFEDIQSGKEWVHRLSAFFVVVKILSLVVGSILVFVSLFIIANTIRLTIINRKEEIEIMRLVGASRLFISVPFFIEGILEGLWGGAMSIGLLYLFYYVVQNKLNLYLVGSVGMLRLSFIPLSLILGLLALGMGIGGIGSLFSLNF